MARAVFGVGAAAILGLAAWGCGKADKPAAATPPPAVEAVVVSGEGAAAEVVASGRVARRREMALSFRVPGVMTGLSVEAGDRVAQGQLLATLDAATYDAGARRAMAGLERARRDLARNQALFERGFVSRQRIDDAGSALKAAQAEYDAAAFDRRWTRLVSPAAGVVLERAAQSGEVVQPGQMVVRIADDRSPLIVRAPAPDREVAGIAPGAPARVFLGAEVGAVTGRVTRIGERAGVQSGAVEVEVELPASADLRSGQIATVRIATRPVQAAGPAMVRLPAEAILEAQGQRAAVMVVEPGTSIARRRNVTFGGFDGDFARVSGLSPGVRVITAGAGFVSDGEKVSVVDPTRLVAAAAPEPAGR